jgi:hypothetical protein
MNNLLTQNPKTEPRETRGILGRTVLEKKKDDAEEGHTEEQIVAVLRQGEAGKKVADILRGHAKTGQRWSGQNWPTEVAGD